MKSILRTAGINAVSLSLSSQIPTGIRVSGGVFVFIEAGLLFSLISLLLRPILHIVTLPLHVLTFGLITYLINAALLYILTLFAPSVSVHPFTFSGVTVAGLVIPRITFNLFFSYIVSAAVLSFFYSFFTWLIK